MQTDTEVNDTDNYGGVRRQKQMNAIANINEEMSQL
jgi:hypothetical protein